MQVLNVDGVTGGFNFQVKKYDIERIHTHTHTHIGLVDAYYNIYFVKKQCAQR